jgi:hypothetical protein
MADMSKKERKINHGILHFYHLTHTLRVKILKQIAKLDCKIFTIRIDKHKFSLLFQYDTHSFYNILTTLLLSKIFEMNVISKNEAIEFIASRRETKKILNANFIFTIEQYMKKRNLNIKVLVDSTSKRK